jgi:hypothetical protein
VEELALISVALNERLTALDERVHGPRPGTPAVNASDAPEPVRGAIESIDVLVDRVRAILGNCHGEVGSLERL